LILSGAQRKYLLFTHCCRLSEINDWTVLLLEAGGEKPPQADVPAFIHFNWESRLDWQYQTQPDEGYCGGKPCTWNAGKVLGGGSVLNGMIYNRGNARSYDKWKELGKHSVGEISSCHGDEYEDGCRL
jgi:choline dehydrogenase-like flavoprotein